MKLKHSVDIQGIKIPKGTELHFSIEGITTYKNKMISVYDIPTSAIEGVTKMSTMTSMISFDKVQAGARGFDIEGNAIIVIDKAKGGDGLYGLMTKYDLPAPKPVSNEFEEYVVVKTSQNLLSIAQYGLDQTYAIES